MKSADFRMIGFSSMWTRSNHGTIFDCDTLTSSARSCAVPSTGLDEPGKQILQSPGHAPYYGSYTDRLPKRLPSIVVDWDATAGCLLANDTSSILDAEGH